jgi:uncharacterized protein
LNRQKWVAAKICRKACDSMPDQPPPQPRPALARASAVIDTQVVLDWLWFADARVAPLAAAVEGGQIVWLATARMRAELQSVLARLPPRSSAGSAEHALTSFDKRVQLRADISLPASPRVSDRDDQMFVDLALSAGAAWLFSRDKALLRLKRRLRTLGCTVTTPEAAFEAIKALKEQSAPGI